MGYAVMVIYNNEWYCSLGEKRMAVVIYQFAEHCSFCTLPSWVLWLYARLLLRATYVPVANHIASPHLGPSCARLPRRFYHFQRTRSYHNVAAASATPTALNVFLFVNLTSTLCAHSMYRAQPWFVSRRIKRPRGHHPYSSMQTCGQSTCRQTARSSW